MKDIYINDKFLNVELHGNSVILNINYCLFIENVNYCLFTENKTFEYRDKLVKLLEKLHEDDSIKVVIISDQHENYSLDSFKEIWNSIFEREDYEDSILRVFRIFDQVFLKIMILNKVVISMDSKCSNPMLFNFGMAADLRIVSNDFHVDNDNTNMINIPKGGCVYSESSIKTYINPVKLLFLREKLFSPELLAHKLIDQVFYSEDIKDKTLAIAKRFEGIDYSEVEAVKAVIPRKLRKIELTLQSENEFLMSCIRKRKNKNTQEIQRFH